LRNFAKPRKFKGFAILIRTKENKDETFYVQNATKKCSILQQVRYFATLVPLFGIPSMIVIPATAGI